ncbi:MAG: RNA polymerase sigma-70 factor [Odoribacteraceae bacterium]|jgi:RNA polymerase sigma-70 factor (ECF subfamily)|nr:RNA polymerase sigma-70 factor [Odoribacteraceae bacterium]
MMNLNYTDDFVLATGVKRGSEEAFDYLFRTRYARMCRVARAFVNDADAAEDVVQEIFSTLWQHYQRVDAGRSIDAYLFTAVRNACLNHLRSTRQRAGVEALLQESVPPEAMAGTDDPRVARLWHAIETLPLQCKIIFKLVAIEEMKYREVAEHMEISVNTVKTQVKIAYRVLREKVDGEALLLCLAAARGRTGGTNPAFFAFLNE